MSAGFKTIKEYSTKWTAVEKVPYSFQNFHLILGKYSTIAAELLENDTQMSPSVPPWFYKQHKIKKNITTTNKEQKCSLAEIPEDQ